MEIAVTGDWQAGLEHLSRALGVLKPLLRAGDMLSRVSDRTFVVLLPGFSTDEGLAWATRLLQADWPGWVCTLVPPSGSARTALESLAEAVQALETEG